MTATPIRSLANVLRPPAATTTTTTTTRRVSRASYVLIAALTLVGFVGLWHSRDPVDVRLLLSFLVDGLGFAVAGLTLLIRGGGRDAAVSTLGAGLLLLLGTAVATAGIPGARFVGLAGLLIVLPVAVVAFPARALRPWLVLALAGLLVVLGVAALFSLDHANTLASFIAAQATVLGCDLWWRTEHSAGDARRSLLWLFYGLGFTVIVGGHVVFLVDGGKGRTIDDVALACALLITLVVPLTMTIGALAPRLRDIRQLISQTVLYIVMLELSLALFIGALSLARWRGHEPSNQVLGIIAIALAAGFHPALVRVRRILDEMLFGGTADPVATMTAFGAHLRSETDPRSWAQALRVALALPRVEIWQDGELVGASGDAVELTHTIPLVAGEADIGQLIVGLPGDTTVLPGPTLGVINLVAAPLARALQAVRLAEQLRESREHVVVALEEERRRLRRDLHDGLGPVLTGVSYTADAAHNLVRSDPAQAQQLLLDLRADVSSAIADIRRIVLGLRPPALDELGLVGAVLHQTSRLYSGGGAPLVVRVRELTPLPALPAAIEVAAYRIAVEAATNAARHSDATEVLVEVDLANAALVLTATDNGHGVHGAWRPGVGLSSMRERVEQVGGTLEARPTADGGRVRATLPL